MICQHWRNLICWENTSEYGFQHDGTVRLFGTRGQRFLHCTGTKGQQDKLKILPRDETSRPVLSQNIPRDVLFLGNPTSEYMRHYNPLLIWTPLNYTPQILSFKKVSCNINRSSVSTAHFDRLTNHTLFFHFFQISKDSILSFVESFISLPNSASDLPL